MTLNINIKILNLIYIYDISVEEIIDEPVRYLVK